MKYIVQTTADVINPEPDRRSKDWNKKPVIAAGNRFIVSSDLTGDGYGTIQSSDERYAWVTNRSALGKLIVANSKRVEPVSVRELSEVHGCAFGGSEILRILVKLGHVTPEHFKAVAEIAAKDENF